MMSPQQVVDYMMERDYFSQWLGIEVLDIREGYCKLRMTTRKEMLNGFGIVHGGICYSLADSALAFASNSYILSVSLSVTVNYPKPTREGDTLIAEVHPKFHSPRAPPSYDITVHNEASGEVVTDSRGTVFRKGVGVRGGRR